MFLLVLVLGGLVPLPFGFLFVALFLLWPVDVLYDIVNFHFVHLHVVFRRRLRFLFRGVGRRLKVLCLCHRLGSDGSGHFGLETLVLHRSFCDPLRRLVDFTHV